MKTTKSILAVFFVLLTAQIASAYYCPSTGRWLSRDPVGEPGFQVLMAAAQAPIAATSSRWINRDPISAQGKKTDAATAFLNAIGIKSRPLKPNTSSNPDADQNTVNLYVFVGNDPVIVVDGSGLFGLPNVCRQPLPLPACSSVCDSYGNEEYPGLEVSLQCFCKCAGDSPWAKAVRGCLACAHAHGVGVETAHVECYALASLYHIPPTATLAKCYLECGGKPIPQPW
jgi:hypothetical protein